MSEQLEDQTRNSRGVAETSKACRESAGSHAGKAARRHDIGTAVAVIDAKLVTGAGRGLSSAGVLRDAQGLCERQGERHGIRQHV